jgi:hypothetical protein
MRASARRAPSTMATTKTSQTSTMESIHIP